MEYNDFPFDGQDQGPDEDSFIAACMRPPADGAADSPLRTHLYTQATQTHPVNISQQERNTRSTKHSRSSTSVGGYTIDDLFDRTTRSTTYTEGGSAPPRAQGESAPPERSGAGRRAAQDEQLRQMEMAFVDKSLEARMQQARDSYVAAPPPNQMAENEVATAFSAISLKGTKLVARLDGIQCGIDAQQNNAMKIYNGKKPFGFSDDESEWCKNLAGKLSVSSDELLEIIDIAKDILKNVSIIRTRCGK